MATTRPRPTPAEASPPGIFPIWPGACAAVLIAGALIALEFGKSLPRPFVDLCSGAMSLAHVMTAFSAITLIGDATVVSIWEQSLAELRERMDDESTAAPFLDDLAEREAARSAALQGDRDVTSRRQSLRRLCLVPAYLAPMIGFAQVVRTPLVPSWFEQVGPLLLSLLESGFVVLLSLGVSNSARVVRLGWLALVSGADHGHLKGGASR